MYKLLLVSDREEVLNAFAQVQNWERQGFKPPHIRHDFEGAKDSLAKHHADGIAIAVSPEEEEKILSYLQEFFPNVSIFQAGTNPEEVLRYLNELNILLNRIHADFSNDRFREIDMLQECRHEFFRKVLTGRIQQKGDIFRGMRLLRSRMDADRPCLLVELEQPSARDDDKLEGRWHYGDVRLEIALRNSFGGDVAGIHILPTVHTDGRILVLCCPLHGITTKISGESMTSMLTNRITEGISHLKEFFGLDLHISEIRVLPSLYALCADASDEMQ
ncbi:MAG: hypothetical protein IKQ45_06960 [Clostridia bacterium]|nr:hypothetical protein [Clostridia bacterium]